MRKPILILIAALAVGLCALACVALAAGYFLLQPGPLHAVEYRASGSGRAAVAYYNQDGATQRLDAALPWTWQAQQHSRDRLFISAQVADERPGAWVECDILIDGRPFQHSRGTGAGSTATCGGVVP